MSTKTLRKRIALVAVSALGFGLMSAMPANAAEADADEVTALALSGTGNTFLTGNVVTMNLALDVAAALDDDDDLTIKGIITSQPGTSAINVTATRAAATLTTDGTAETCAVGPATATAGNPGSLTLTCAGTAGNELDASQTLGSFKFTPSTVGSYTLTAWHDANADGLITAGEVSTSSTVIITNTGQGLTEFSLSNQTTDNTHTSVTTVALTSAFNSARVGTQVAFTPTFTVKTLVDAGVSTTSSKATAGYSLSKPAGSATALSVASAVKVGATASLADNATESLVMPNVTFTQMLLEPTL